MVEKKSFLTQALCVISDFIKFIQMVALRVKATSKGNNGASCYNDCHSSWYLNGKTTYHCKECGESIK